MKQVIKMSDKTKEVGEYFKSDRFASYVGCNIEYAEEGRAVVSLEVEENLLNGNNVVQGGALFTLGDLACAAAACADGIKCVSSAGDISYLSPGTGKKLYAESLAVKRGRTLSYYDFTIKNDLGKLVAKGSFTMFSVLK